MQNNQKKQKNKKASKLIRKFWSFFWSFIQLILLWHYFVYCIITILIWFWSIFLVNGNKVMVIRLVNPITVNKKNSWTFIYASMFCILWQTEAASARGQ